MIPHLRITDTQDSTGSDQATTRRSRTLRACLVGLLAGAAALAATPATAQNQEYSSEQVAIARTVRDVGRGLHASDRAVLAAMEAAMVEGTLHANPQRCEQDHDSAGLFQQRRDWVPAAERPAAGQWCVLGKDPRLDPKWAATHFYTGSPGHRGALAYDQRGSDAHGNPINTAGQLAQATQVSAYPDRYDEREADARALLTRLGKHDGDEPNPYTPEQVCGDGFQIVDHADLKGRGTVYLLWRGTNHENCVVTMKTAQLGKRTATQAFLQPKGQQKVADPGQYQYYAGPVTRSAPGCITWGGAIDGVSYSSPWEHCGT